MKKSAILDLNRETLESSSIHAIPNITRNRFYSIKLMWFVCFLVSSGCCAWFISKSIVDYLNHEVTSKIDIKYVNRLQFPVVAICDINAFTTEYAYEFLRNYSYLDQPNPFLAKFMVNEIKDKRLFGKKLDEMIVLCQFNLNNCNMSTDFEDYYDVYQGNCFRFNAGEKKHFIYKGGILSSLELQLNIGSANKNNYPFSTDNGFLIFITNETSDATLSEGIQISPGFSTRIELNYQIIRKEPDPYSQCTANLISADSYDSECYRKTFNALSNRSYRYTYCYYMCFQKYVGEKCYCQSSIPGFTYRSDLPFCSLSGNIAKDAADFECLVGLWKSFSNDGTVLEECKCPLECEYSEYNYKMSFSEYPTLYHLNNLKAFASKFPSFKHNFTGYSIEDARNSLARVQIYYNELKQTEISESIKTQMSDLVSNIGGLLGLFLGLSFLSLVEFFEIALQTIFSLTQNSDQNRPIGGKISHA